MKVEEILIHKTKLSLIFQKILIITSHVLIH